MEHSKKELIKEIADLFEDYQETYVPGEWESFSKTQKKKKYPFLANWIKIAAVFLLMASVLPFAFNKLVHQRKTDAAVILKPVAKSGTNSPAIDSGRNAAIGSDTASMRLAKITGNPSGGLNSAPVNHTSELTAKQRKIASLNTVFSIPDTTVSEKAHNKKI
ncbi:hypothetical protein [Pedobacter sp. NJ-S-72]